MSQFARTAPEIAFDAATDARSSSHWFNRAKDALAGGISSSARATSTDGQPFPLYMQCGRGGRVEDVDGNEFVDFLLSYGSLILGHAHPTIVRAVSEQLQR